MSSIQIDDAGFAAIMADPKLERARRKLSFHELRLIVRHARESGTDWAERAAKYEAVITELQSKLDVRVSA